MQQESGTGNRESGGEEAAYRGPFPDTEPLLTPRDGLGGNLYPIRAYVEVPDEATKRAPAKPLDPELVQQIEDRRREQADRRRRQIERIIRYVVIVLLVLLATRLVLKLTGASPDAPFTLFIYVATAPFLLPFAAMFPNPSSGRFIFEVTTLVAMIVYPVFTWLILKGVYLYSLHGRLRRRSISYRTTIEENDE